LPDAQPHASRPRHILPVIVISQFAGTSLWFAGNAVLPDLQRELELAPQAIGTITSAVQLGFIAGTLVFATLGIADRHSPRVVFLACALLGALANGGVALAAGLPEPFAAILALRFATGFFLAGIYPVGMKIAAGWYREGLGAALGYLVGALVLGTAFPHLLKGLGQQLPWGTVLGWLSALAAAGGLLMFATVRDGPYLRSSARLDPLALRSILATPGLRASAFGYFGHMWELYTFWAFVPLMIAGYASMHSQPPANAALWSFAVIAAGAVGSAFGGVVSRVTGSARVAFAQLSASGLCCLLSPLAYQLPWPAFIAYLVFWGVVVVGDSPQFSALNAAHAPKASMGSVLTMVNCVGFALTIPSIELMTWLSMRVPVAWWFVPVAIGPAIGLIACRSLVRVRPQDR
jgi:predicted MFS family arabinose efflux permease